MKNILLSFLLLLCMAGNAQRSEQAKAPLAQHQVVIGVNPLPLVNVDQAVLLGVEYRFRSRWSVVGDVGYIGNSRYLEENGKTRGFEVRPAMRYYYSRNGLGYVQGQLLYRRVNYRLTDWLGKNCVNGVPTFEQLQEFRFQKQNVGAAIVLGSIQELSPRWLVDISLGLGLQHRTHNLKAGANSCYVPRGGLFRTAIQDDIWLPTMPIAVKLAYVIQ
jgi:hypothetical protein